MIEHVLQQLGLNEKEIIVYIAILQHGKTSHAALSKMTGINRTTVYAIAKQLLKLGVILEELGDQTRCLYALPPSELTYVLDKQEEILQKKRDLVIAALPEFEQLALHTSYVVPKITFVVESDISKHIKRRHDAWNESIMKADGVFWGFQDPNYVEHFAPLIEWAWRQASMKDVTLQLISSEHPAEQKIDQEKYPRRHIRYWNKSKGFTSTIWVLGDYVVNIMTNQHPFYLTETHDALLAHNMRELFKGIWEDIR